MEWTLALKLVAVYIGTAAASLRLAHRFVSPIRLRVALFLGLAPFLFVGKAMLTGGVYAPIDIPYQAPPLSVHANEMGTEHTQTPLLSDVVFQEIPWRKAVRDAAKNGRLPLWNRFVLSGEPLLAVQQPVVLHPATWIGMLLPLAQGWTLEMALRFLLAILAAYLFLREIGCGEVPSLLGGAAWAFSDYLVFFVGYPLTPAAAPLPLLLLGLRRLVTTADRSAVAITVIALFLITASGHPETLLHCVAGGGLYFLFELFWAEPGRRARAFALALVAGILALGLCAILLLPLAEALPWTVEDFVRKNVFAKTSKAYAIGESALHAVQNGLPYLFGVSGKGEATAGYHEPSAYAGSVLWPFAAAGLLLSKRREKWPLALLGLLGVAMHARAPGVASAIGAIPLFDIGLNERMVFLAAFGLAGLVALGAQSVVEQGRSRWIGAASAAALVALGLAAWGLRLLVPASMEPGYFRYRLLLQAIPLFLVGVTALWSFRLRRALSVGSAALLLLLLQRGLEERDVYPTYPNRVFYPPLEVFEKIPRGLPYRFTAVGFSFIPNIAALYELEDVRGYEAMTFRPLFDTEALWCVPQPVWFNRVDDPTRPFLSFLNVRWVYAAPGFHPPEGWSVLHQSSEGMLLENPRVLPRAFVPLEIADEPTPDRVLSLLSTISDFGQRGVVAQEPPAGAAAGTWRRNGEATVEIVSYLPQEITLAVDARVSTIAATSVASWPGWRLTIDGDSAPLLSYNHAFLAFRAPAGQHVAVLRYWPRSFVHGLLLSGMTLLATLFLGVSRRLGPSR